MELYGYLTMQIGNSVSETYYESGLEAYNQMDYETAIEHLQKAYQYDPTNDEALYYLGVSYYDSGDINNAKEAFNELINVFPESALINKARQKIEEIGD
ncbi:MAG TPA: tetratricopeptide repeat protein [Lachnospiraceae bacterium]|nr:tetratricopeptide repeat protein [Lachnospiraceae bacterium]